MLAVIVHRASRGISQSTFFFETKIDKAENLLSDLDTNQGKDTFLIVKVFGVTVGKLHFQDV